MKGGIVLPSDLVALDRAEGQPQREGRVGVDRVALVVERSPWRSAAYCAVCGSSTCVLARLADGAGVGVDEPGRA